MDRQAGRAEVPPHARDQGTGPNDHLGHAPDRPGGQLGLGPDGGHARVRGRLPDLTPTAEPGCPQAPPGV